MSENPQNTEVTIADCIKKAEKFYFYMNEQGSSWQAEKSRTSSLLAIAKSLDKLCTMLETICSTRKD